MKIVADENIPELEAIFSNPTFRFTRLSGRHINAEDVRDADALIVRSVTSVNRALLEGSSVRFVGTCTIGTDHMDTAYLDEAGIQWANAPGCNANSVFEYVIAALAALGESLQGKKVGIVGCGNVGGHLYQRLNTLGIQCHCYDPFLSKKDNPDLGDLDAVLDCDIVSVHTPFTQQGPHPTYHLIDAAALKRLRPGTVLLSCGRGPAVDNAALKSLLERGVDLRVVLDVWEPEPDIDTDLLTMVDIATPHIAGYSYDGKLMGGTMIFNALQKFLDDKATPAKPKLLSEQPLIKAKPGTWEEALFDVVLQAYNIRRDDQNLRAAVSHPEGIAHAFDALRKHYIQRYEFRHFEVDCSAVGAQENIELKRYLDALGFRLGASDV